MVVDHSDFVPDKLEAWINFKNVDFQYGENLPQVSKKVSFRINKGETVALVGHSGVGKSTCANLLLRFWDASGGVVEIGGYNIRDFTQQTLREMISYVPQDVYLFNMSVAENIKLGKPDASEEEIKRAAKEALAHEFIEKLPEGYDTNLGERGSQLSGGQRQRIAIARALLKNAPILLMDEAVSNLDTQNERELQEILLKLRKDKTTLIISHRLSTILSADRIIVLDKGEVAEVGRHDELAKKGGTYYRLLGSQRDGIVA
ncbi:ABC transporter ATP-binding protein [Desulfosporosinus meridiei]|uniref:ABC transporter ATP-binding protein n=1 Tax=Desulfosporosinus meridiei TaxID=79209 RepID=UPI0002314A8E|nr:ATP-binding cassette domain-containing protein [Desulfosporosinus meridiei]